MVNAQFEQKIFTAMALIVAPLSLIAANWIPLLGAFGTTAMVGYWLYSRSRPHASLGALPWLLLFIVLWGALSSAWAEGPGDSLATAGKMLAVTATALAMILGTARVDAAGRHAVGTALTIGLGLTVGVLIVELASDGFVYRFFRGLLADEYSQFNPFDRRAVMERHYAHATSVLALLLWPVCLTVSRRFGRVWAVAAFLVTLATVAQFTTAASTVAIGFGAAIFLTAIAFPRTVGRVLIGLVVVLVVLTPGFSVLAPAARQGLAEMGVTNGSVYHRLVILEYGADQLRERPVIGWGMRGSRNLPGATEYVDIVVLPDGGTLPGVLMNLHPHNGLLQIWLELGLPGIIATAALLVLLVRWIGARISDIGTRAICFAAFGSGLTLIEISYGIWQGWWQATLWLALALTLVLFGPEPRSAINKKARVSDVG